MKKRIWWLVVFAGGRCLGALETRALARHWLDHSIGARLVRCVESP